MSKTIIWIEDDYAIIEPVVYQIRKAGYQITNIPNVKEASEKLELIKEADLILLDMGLPEPSISGENSGEYPGLLLLRELLYEHNVTTPILVFTVFRNTALKKELNNLVGDRVLFKPLRPSILKQRIEEILQEQ